MLKQEPIASPDEAPPQRATTDQLIDAAARADEAVACAVRHQWDVTVKFMLTMFGIVAAVLAAYAQARKFISAPMGWSMASACMAAWLFKAWWQVSWHKRMSGLVEEARRLRQNPRHPAELRAAPWRRETLAYGLCGVLGVSLLSALAASVLILGAAGVVS